MHGVSRTEKNHRWFHLEVCEGSMTHLSHIIYGAVVAHFLRVIWRRMILGAPAPAPKSMFTAPVRRPMTREEILAEQEPWEPPT